MPQESTTTPRRTQNERVKESSRRLLDAAVALIGEQGFNKTTVAQIGRRAGYSHSMVHARYGSKTALLEAIFRDQWQTRLVPDIDDSLSGLERVLSQLDQLIAAINDERELFRTIIVLSFEIPAHAETMKPWYREWFERYYARMAENLELGERDGTIRPGLDHRAEAERFVTYGSGLCFMWSLDWDGYDMKRALTDWRTRLEADYAAE